MKVDPGDRVLTFRLLQSKAEQFILFKDDGGKISVSAKKYQKVGRGGKGHALFKRGKLTSAEVPEVALPVFPGEKNSE